VIEVLLFKWVSSDPFVEIPSLLVLVLAVVCVGLLDVVTGPLVVVIETSSCLRKRKSLRSPATVIIRKQKASRRKSLGRCAQIILGAKRLSTANF